MAPISSLFAAMLIFNSQLISSQTISCTTVEGTMSTTGDDDLSSIECPAETPIMVSCGYYSEGGGRDGGYISGDTCYAQNGADGDGAKAYARCCSIIGGAECIDESETLVNPSDDTLIKIECPSDYQVTGCTVNSNWKKFDGILPYDGNYCQLHSSIRTVTGYARCCKPSVTTATLSCNIVSATSIGQTGSVSCESGIMTGCSGTEFWNKINRWYIDGNTCHVERMDSNGKAWTVSGICCEVSTPAPTSNPTPAPTATPTASPTLDGCDFDIDAYLEKCYGVDNGFPAMKIKSPFDQYTDNRQNYFEPQDRYNYDDYPKQNGYDPNDNLILNILYINSFAIVVILLLLGYLVYTNGCSTRKEAGYGKVYDTEYDHVSERRAINA